MISSEIISIPNVVDRASITNLIKKRLGFYKRQLIYIPVEEEENETVYSIRCANYITPNICKFTNKPCSMLSSFDWTSFKYYKTAYIPTNCPLYFNQKPHKNFEIIIQTIKL